MVKMSKNEIFVDTLQQISPRSDVAAPLGQFVFSPLCQICAAPVESRFSRCLFVAIMCKHDVINKTGFT